MDILNTFKQLRDDIKTWVTVNLNALNAKIDEKTIPIDNELSATSTNPVQNKTITNAINNIPRFSGDYNDLTNAPNITEDESGEINIADSNGNVIFKIDSDGTHTTSLSLNGEDVSSELDKLNDKINNINTFSGDYNDLTNAPNISEDESGNMIVADESGNIIFKADADGIHTTAISLNGEVAASEKYVDNAIANINIPETNLTGYATETYVDNKVADLVNSAPEALNTLGELAIALEDHEDAYYALLEIVSNKATQADLENLKEELSESITAEAEDWKVVDSNGNIIFSVDNAGAHTTNLTLNGEEVATEAYVNEAIGNIEFPETDLTSYATKKYVDNAISAIPETDLSNYYTKEQTDTAIDVAKEEISKSIITESNEWKVIDEAGNIIFSVDASGAHTTALSLNGVSVATEDYVDNKEYDFFVIKSSVPGSTKKFKITIDDSGVLTASEIE